MRRHVRILAAFLFLLLAAVPVAAQEILLYPLSARVVSMGATGAADNATPSTIVVNPANVIGAPRLYAQAAMETFDPGDGDYWVRRANAGTALRVGSGGVTLGCDLSYTRLHFESNDAFVGTESLTDDLLALVAGVGFASGPDDFFVGTAVKRYSSSISQGDYLTSLTVKDEADAMAFDLGFEYRHRATLQGWDVNSALGAAVVNAGEDIEYKYSSDHMPRRFNFGVNTRLVSPPVEVLSASVPLIALCVSLDATQPRDDDWEWMAGTELAVAQVFFLRSGFHTYTGSSSPDPALGSWGAGVGIPAGNFRARFDYGRRGEFMGKFERFELTLEWTP